MASKRGVCRSKDHIPSYPCIQSTNTYKDPSIDPLDRSISDLVSHTVAAGSLPDTFWIPCNYQLIHRITLILLLVESGLYQETVACRKDPGNNTLGKVGRNCRQRHHYSQDQKAYRHSDHKTTYYLANFITPFTRHTGYTWTQKKRINLAAGHRRISEDTMYAFDPTIVHRH